MLFYFFHFNSKLDFFETSNQSIASCTVYQLILVRYSSSRTSHMEILTGAFRRQMYYSSAITQERLKGKQICQILRSDKLNEGRSNSLLLCGVRIEINIITGQKKSIETRIKA